MARTTMLRGFRVREADPSRPFAIRDSLTEGDLLRLGTLPNCSEVPVPVARPLELPAWPNGAQAAVSLTFDVDAESPWLGVSLETGGPSAVREYNRLTTLSAGRFGVDRGLPRILELLAEHKIPATFYVPGHTAEQHPAAIEGIVEAGHEVAHHGHLHLRTDRVAPSAQREEIEQGLVALENCVGRPVGYRSPAWELTPATFDALCEYGFEYDSSLMGDDRPYIACLGERELVELPVHWSLDDWPYFSFFNNAGGVLMDADVPMRVWLEEFTSAQADGRHVTYTLHPEIIGRGYRFAAFRRFVESVAAHTPWFATHRELARLADSVREARTEAATDASS
jgi:peptidoglycan-N-acetylglucosamine deacetylase